jgi:hypothetical protein
VNDERQLSLGTAFCASSVGRFTLTAITLSSLFGYSKILSRP